MAKANARAKAKARAMAKAMARKAKATAKARAMTKAVARKVKATAKARARKALPKSSRTIAGRLTGRHAGRQAREGGMTPPMLAEGFRNPSPSTTAAGFPHNEQYSSDPCQSLEPAHQT